MCRLLALPLKSTKSLDDSGHTHCSQFFVSSFFIYFFVFIFCFVHFPSSKRKTIFIYSTNQIDLPKMSLQKTRSMQKLSANCPFCAATFRSPIALQAHAVYSHRIGFLTCIWCAEIVENEKAIQQHADACTESNKQKVNISATPRKIRKKKLCFHCIILRFINIS